MQQTQQDCRGLIKIGWITSIALPLAGFAIGLVLVTRPAQAAVRQGTRIVAVSLVAFTAWFGVGYLIAGAIASAAHQRAVAAACKRAADALLGQSPATLAGLEAQTQQFGQFLQSNPQCSGQGGP